jgi:AraC family transcriptional regulator, positive regulator of tynA and feaB
MALTDLEHAAPRERLAALSEIASQSLIEASLSEVGNRPARGDARAKVLGPLGLFEISAANIRVERTRAHVARSRSSSYLVNIQIAGAISVRWGEQDIYVSCGDILITDSEHAYEVDGERPFSQLIVRMPKPWVDARVARPDVVSGSLLRRDNPMAQLLAGYLRKGFDTAADLGADGAEMFAAHSIDLLALALGASQADQAPPARALREALFVRAGRLIALRFAEPCLAPDCVARSLGISARLLQRIFAERGTTVMQRVWDQRVSRAAKLLAMPDASHRSITEIAFACGFNDSAHFTRAFAARVGATPSQWRRRTREEREGAPGA